MTETKLSYNLLNREYDRLVCVQSMEMLGKDLGSSGQYEFHNILERWLIAYANSAQNEIARSELKNIDAIFGSGAAIASIDDKFKSECAEKSIVFDAEPLHKLVTAFCKSDMRNDEGKLEITRDAVTYGSFRMTVPEKRLAALRKLATDEQIAVCAMRYACLLPRGQQWSLPCSFYKVAASDYLASLEGFASPFNSQMLMFGKSFCSLFPDTDRVFGSVGNFFTATLRGVVVVNPPFVPAILERTVSKCTESLAAAPAATPVKFIIIVPNWSDAQFIKNLDTLYKKYDGYLETLEPGTYRFEDTSVDKPIVARFRSRLYVVASNYKKQNYTKLVAALK